MNHRLTQKEEEIGMQDLGPLHNFVQLGVSRGHQLVEDLEQKLKLGGWLNMKGCNDKGMIGADLICDAAAIVSTFSNLITLLNSIPDGGQPLAVKLPEGFVLEGDNSSSPIASSSPLSVTCPPSPLPSKQMKNNIVQPSSSFCWINTPPQSPRSTTTTFAKRSIASSQTRSLDSSLNLEANLNLAENSMEALSNETKVESDINPHPPFSKRRRYMPKRPSKLHTSNTEQGNEAPLMDGYIWRKYGQKDILGSRHPRSYYRCTYKTKLGCPAVKYVQKSNDDPQAFHVIYRGEHICQFTNPFRPQFYSHSTLPLASFQDSKFNSTHTPHAPCLHKNPSYLALNNNGSLQMGQHVPCFPITKGFELPIISSSTLIENTLGNGLICQPLSSFPVPELARTSKLKTDSNFSNVYPIDLGAGDKSMIMNEFDLPKPTISQAKSFESNQNLNPKVGDQTFEADQMDIKYVRDKSTIISRETSQALKQNWKQLIHPVCLGEIEAYDSSIDPNIFECLGELFSPSTSELELISKSAPLESLPKVFHDSKSDLPLTTTTTEGLPSSSDQSISVVAENFPNFEFESEFILNSPIREVMNELHFQFYD